MGIFHVKGNFKGMRFYLTEVLQVHFYTFSHTVFISQLSMQKMDVKDTITENPSTCLCHVIFFGSKKGFKWLSRKQKC